MLPKSRSSLSVQTEKNNPILKVPRQQFFLSEKIDLEVLFCFSFSTLKVQLKARSDEKAFLSSSSFMRGPQICDKCNMKKILLFFKQ